MGGADEGHGGLNEVATVAAIAAGVVVATGGFVVAIRAIFGFAVTVRDNTLATRTLTGQLKDLTTSIDGRFDGLAQRVAVLEGKAK